MKHTLKTMIWLACWWLGQGVALAAVNLPPFSLPTAIDGTVISLSLIHISQGIVR